MNIRYTKALLCGAALLLVGQGCVSLSGDSSLETSGPAGLFVSTDGAESWRSISLVPTIEGVANAHAASVYTLHQDMLDSEALYWGSRASGMYYSYDAGRSWQRPEAPMSAGFIYDIEVDTQDTCTIYASAGIKAYRSTDCNKHWEEMYQEGGNDRVVAIETDPFSRSRLYMLKRGGDVLRSEDNGLSWKTIHRFSRATLSKIHVDPHTPDTLYISTFKRGPFRSDDGGLTWVSLVEGMEEFKGAKEFRSFHVYEGQADTLYWVSGYGILRSEDKGSTWQEVPIIPSPGSVKIYAFAVNPQNENEMYYTATIDTRSTMYKTVDGGQNWITKRLPSGQLPTQLLVHRENPQWVYMGFTVPPN